MSNNETILRKVKKDVRNKSIVIDYLELKMPIKDIGEKYGLTKFAIYNILHTYNITITKQKTATQFYETISNEYKNGAEVQQLSVKHNVSVLTIYRALKLTNTQIRKSMPTSTQQQIINKLLSGQRQTDIAKELHVSRQYINDINKKFIKEKHNEQE